MSYYVGQQIICISSGPWSQSFADGHIENLTVFPIKGVIYTIDAFCTSFKDGVVLKELDHPMGDHCSWNLRDFRPLEKKKTSISVFEKLLITKKQEVDA